MAGVEGRGRAKRRTVRWLHFLQLFVNCLNFSVPRERVDSMDTRHGVAQDADWGGGEEGHRTASPRDDRW